MEHFPHVVPISETKFAGYFTAKGHTVFLFIQFPLEWSTGKSLRDTRILMDCESFKQLNTLAPILTQNISVLRNVQDFFKELHAFLLRGLPPNPSPVLQSSILTELYNDLQSVEPHILTIDSHFSNLQFHHLLSLPSSIEVIVDCKIQENYPMTSPVFSCDFIPDEKKVISVAWNMTTRFSSALEQISNLLTSYLPFWQELIDLDSTLMIKGSTHLSQPERTIDLGDFCSLKLYVYPFHPRSGNYVSDWQFLGPPSKVHPYQFKFHQKLLTTWDSQCSIIQNLESILEIPLPKRRHTTEDTLNDITAVETLSVCEICYDSLRPTDWDGMSSKNQHEMKEDVTCGCGRMYHRDCLITLFQRSGKKTAFKVIFGECLYCSAPLTVKLF